MFDSEKTNEVDSTTSIVVRACFDAASIGVAPNTDCRNGSVHDFFEPSIER